MDAGVSAAQSRGLHERQRIAFLCGLVPTLVVLAALTLAPALYLFVVSLTPATPTNPGSLSDFPPLRKTI